MPKIWNAAKCHKELASWLRVQENFQYAQPIAELEEIRDFGKQVGVILTNLWQLSLWHGRVAADAFWESRDAQGLSAISTAIACDLVRITVNLNLQKRLAHKPSREGLEVDGLSLLRAMAFGDEVIARLAANHALACFADGVYNLPISTTVGVYALKLCCVSYDLVDPFIGVSVPEYTAYQSITQHWKDSDPEGHLVSVLLEACSYHIDQSHEITNKDFYEFSWSEYQLIPVEILAVLRLRNDRGLSPIVLDHPLMKLPSAHFRSIANPPFYPEFLRNLIRRLRANDVDLAAGLEALA